MKTLARLLGGLSAVVSLTLLLPPRILARSQLAIVSAIGGALSPFVAFAGLLGSALGLLTRDTLATGLGATGAGVATRHIAQNIQPHTEFERVYGPNWPEHIPAHRRSGFLTARWAPNQRFNTSYVAVQRDVVVGTHVETNRPLLADLWTPPTHVARSGLTYLYLHGSAWHFLDKGFATDATFAHLANQGHLVVDLAYTLAPEANIIEMQHDVKRAIHYLKTHADDLQIDPDRIVLAGGSAGGHLALLAGYTPTDARLRPADLPLDADLTVCGIVSYYGFPDLITAQGWFESISTSPLAGSEEQLKTTLDMLAKLANSDTPLYDPNSQLPIRTPADILPSAIGAPMHAAPARWNLVSPINHVGDHCPPTLLLQGTADVGGMLPDARRLHRALKQVGTTALLIEFPNSQHGFDLFFPQLSPAAHAALYDTERFLALLAR